MRLSGNNFDTSRRQISGQFEVWPRSGAIIGGALPLSRNGVGIPQAHAQAGPAAAPAAGEGTATI